MIPAAGFACNFHIVMAGLGNRRVRILSGIVRIIANHLHYPIEIHCPLTPPLGDGEHILGNGLFPSLPLDPAGFDVTS